jgi:hypothetical protein
MPRIVLSYRRADSLAMAGRIRDRLARHYGAKAVFRDLESIPIAERFPEFIRGVIAEADVVLSLVGPDWIGGSGEQARINEAGDPVRLEIETALNLGLPVVPVLIGASAMPSAKQLPPRLQDFPSLNAARVDPGSDFEHHMQRLIAAIDSRVAQPQSFVAALLIVDGCDSLLRGMMTIGAAGSLTTADVLTADAFWAAFGLAELLTAAGTLLDWPLERWIGALVCAAGALLSVRVVSGTALSLQDLWAMHQYAFAVLFALAGVFYLLGWQRNIGEGWKLDARLARLLSAGAFLLFVVVAAALSVADVAAQAKTASEHLRLAALGAVAAAVVVYFGVRSRRS